MSWHNASASVPVPGAPLESLLIQVYGIPAPQGSKSFKGMRTDKKTGRQMAIMAESSKKVAPWRKAVEKAAKVVMAGRAPLDGPLVVEAWFTMPKPASAPKRRQVYPCVMPDLSKLARSTEDALTDAGVWADDSRVVGYASLWKVYPNEHPFALSVPGANVYVWTLAAWLAHTSYGREILVDGRFGDGRGTPRLPPRPGT